MREDLVQAATADVGQECDHPGSEARVWAIRISARWHASIEAVIDTGRLLIEAKASLRHGEWGGMIDEMLPFSARTAQTLMKIARDVRLSEPKTLLLLPASWGTLYEITKLSDDEIRTAIEKKIIRPDTERWEIEGFRRQIEAPVRPIANENQWAPSLGSPDPRRWTVAQLRLNAKRLKALLDHVGAASEIAQVGEIVSDAKLKKIWGPK